MTPRPLTIPTMGTPYVRQHMRGHRQMVVLSRRLAAPADGTTTPAIEASAGSESAR